jgi:hypothetical protein
MTKPSKRETDLEEPAVERREFLALGGAAAASLLAGCTSPAGAIGGGESALGADPSDELVAAWEDFCESLKAAAPPILRAPAQSPSERAAALRYLTRLVSQSFDRFVEHDDPAFPRFYRSQHHTSQQGGPNPDTSYLDTRVSGAYEYRITGNRRDVRFVTFSLMRGLAALREGKPGFVDNIVGNDLVVDAGGNFEIRIGRERPTGWVGNFMRSTADTESLAVRQIFGQWHEERPMELRIERLGGEGERPAPLDFDEMAGTLRHIGRHTAFMTDFWVKDLARFQGTPNEFLEYQKRDPKKRSIAYTPGGVALVGIWKVQANEALVIEVEPPASPYWAYEVGDYWFEVDYWNAFCGMNNTQLEADADGLVRTVISHDDPEGWPNWLGTSGHSTGHMVFRWLASSEEVQPRCRLVKRADLERHLPSSTRRIPRAERALRLAQRREGLRRRWPA